MSRPQCHSATGRIMSMKNSNYNIGNQTRDYPTCSAVPQPTAPPRAPYIWLTQEYFVLFPFTLLLTAVGLLCIKLLSYVYYCHLMCIVLLRVCIAVLYTLVAGLLARSQYPEGPDTGHLGTSFPWFPPVYKRMLRWFPRLQVATAYFSCSSPDLTHWGRGHLNCLNARSRSL